jgi:tetratricopeptide (TPR) repeat protein
MYPEALAEAQTATQLNPADPTSQLLIGDLSRTLNDIPTAAAAYEQALLINPDLDNAWNVHLNLALLYQEMGQLGDSLLHAQAALPFAPEEQKSQIENFIAQLESLNQ